jgi:YesN/AraC family two-component response regulator
MRSPAAGCPRGVRRWFAAAPAAARLLVAIVERKFKGIQVFTASNGREGLEVFRARLPELLLTDVKMPEMDGVELSEKVREIQPETIIIVISADSGEASLVESRGKGLKIDHFIHKPVDYKKLFSAIELSLETLSCPRPV